MEYFRFLRKTVFILVVLMTIGLSLLIVFLMRHTENLLNSDVRINLTEIVTQNKDAITSRLMMNVHSLDIPSNDFMRILLTENIRDSQHILTALRKYASENNTNNMFIADQTGSVLLPGGNDIDISGRHYFRLAADNIGNISNKVISRINGEEIFVICVPLMFEGTFIGSVQKVLSLREMLDVCSISLFSARGYMYIVNREGYTILHSDHEYCDKKTDNYFRDLYESGNTYASVKMAEDIKNNKNGFSEVTFSSNEIFSAYTPIESIHDWYLITSVPRNTVSPNANTVISWFYAILFVIVFIFTSLITYILIYKNKQRTRIEKIAFYDPITNGNTYNKFVVHANDVLRKNKNKEYFIVKFDIDNFKYINMFYGFTFGDQMLYRINNKIGKKLRPSELIARIYADVFVLLLEDASDERLNALLTAIRGKDVLLYFSMGVYAATDRSNSINIMVDKAGIAAQSVKGKLDKVIARYSDVFDQQSVRNEQTKRAVQQALQNFEFIPFYQPKVNIFTGEIVGSEALVRWKKQDGSFVYPNEFIPLCEQTGQITAIDMQVYDKVLQFLNHLREQGHACKPVSVNVSRVQLQNHNFLDILVSKLAQYDVPPNLIELELTESAIFDNHETIVAFAQSVHKKGFTIAMDDFGSGYSSLNMLKDIPIDVLKIDKGFLSGGNSVRRDIMFSSIVTMGHKLGIKIVVEGVETIENIELMRGCGCAIAQGYYYAKPMEEEAFTALLQRGSIQ